MLVVIAIGGHALSAPGGEGVAGHRARIAGVAAGLGAVARDHRVVITHGNGPQIGLLALRGEAYPEVAPDPLDVVGAETQGMIGYLLEQELGRHLDPSRVSTVLTQVVVDAADEAFSRPSKPIGPVYPAERADQIGLAHRWTMAATSRGARRVVPSPDPVDIVEIAAVRALLEAGHTVICGGGGGIPVVRDDPGLSGVEAVIDKDLTAELLARRLGAGLLAILTDVTGVWTAWPPESGHLIERAGVAAMRDLVLEAGSMGPKVDAACRFVESGGARAAIGSLEQALDVVEGRAGTQVVP